MKPGIEKDTTSHLDEAFDQRMRGLHATALDQLTPQALARLRSARQQAQIAAPSRGHAWRWVAATAFSAVLAVTLGLQLLPNSSPTPVVKPIVASTNNDDVYADGVSALDENPDLYMWLASAEAEPLAME